MDQRISLISLFVDDIERAKVFYREAFGWEPRDGGDGIVFYQLGGIVLGLMTPRVWAKERTGFAPRPGYHSINLASPADVDAAIARIRAVAGAKIAVEPHEADWGGYTSYVEDPWGNLWEFAHNPFWTLTPAGETLLEPPQ